MNEVYLFIYSFCLFLSATQHNDTELLYKPGVQLFLPFGLSTNVSGAAISDTAVIIIGGLWAISSLLKRGFSGRWE